MSQATEIEAARDQRVLHAIQDQHCRRENAGNRSETVAVASRKLPSQSSDSEKRAAQERDRRLYQEHRTDSDMRDLWLGSKIPKRHAERKEFKEDDSAKGWRTTGKGIVEKLGSGFLVALTGIRGNGKTQLAVCAIREAARRLMSCRYVKAMDVFLEMRESFKGNGTELDTVNKYACFDLLAIDELGVRGESAWEDRVLTHLLDRRYDDRRDTILISNQSEGDFAEAVGASVMSRLTETGGIIQCDWPSFR